MPTVKLYCPTTKQSSELLITAHQTPPSVALAVRNKLGLKYAALFDTEAKPIADPKTLEEGSRVLVAVSENDKILPDAAPGWVMYEGEEGEDLNQDCDIYGQDWKALDNGGMCLHITNLNEQKPKTRNTLRITRPYDDVDTNFKAIDGSSSTSPAEHETAIEERWGVKLEKFLPDNMKPAKHKIAANALDPQVLAAIDLLSSFTHGQPLLAQEVLVEAVALRTDADQQDEADKDPVVRKQDIAIAIEVAYERAGLREINVTKVKSEKTQAKEKMKAAKAVKKTIDKSKKKDGEDEQGGQAVIIQVHDAGSQQ